MIKGVLWVTPPNPSAFLLLHAHAWPRAASSLPALLLLSCRAQDRVTPASTGEESTRALALLSDLIFAFSSLLIRRWNIICQEIIKHFQHGGGHISSHSHSRGFPGPLPPGDRGCSGSQTQHPTAD